MSGIPGNVRTCFRKRSPILQRALRRICSPRLSNDLILERRLLALGEEEVKNLKFGTRPASIDWTTTVPSQIPRLALKELCQKPEEQRFQLHGIYPLGCPWELRLSANLVSLHIRATINAGWSSLATAMCLS